MNSGSVVAIEIKNSPTINGGKLKSSVKVVANFTIRFEEMNKPINAIRKITSQ